MINQIIRAMHHILVLVSLLLVSIFGCKSSRYNESVGKSTEIEKNKTSNQPYVFKYCTGRNSCPELFDCYHTYFLSDKLFDYETSRQSRKFFRFDSLMDCTISVYINDKNKRDLADNCLYNFYSKVHLESVKENRSGMPIGTLEMHPLNRWNSRKSFDVCILLMSKNEHDSMGHGDCTNVGYKFFMQVVLPKIKSIDGVDFWTYFDRNNKGDHGPADCYDSFYEAIYTLLTKAWEEGKI